MEAASDNTRLTIPVGPNGDVTGVFTPALTLAQVQAIDHEAREVGRETGQLSQVVRVLIEFSNQTSRKLAIEGGAMRSG